ncbi:MAG: hypothetical protein AAFY28_15770, partial [Actinomycetota bacterium]
RPDAELTAVWSGAHLGTRDATLGVESGSTIELSVAFADTNTVPMAIDRAASRVGGVQPHQASGSIAVEYSPTLTVIDGLDSTIALGYHQPAINYPYLPEMRDLQVSDLRVLVDADGNTEAHVDGWARHYDVSTMAHERRNDLTHATAELSPLTGQLTIDVHSAWGHEGTLRFSGDFDGSVGVNATVDRNRSTIGGKTGPYHAQGSVAGDADTLALSASRITGTAQHGETDEFVELTQLELALDANGAITSASVTGSVKIEERRWPGMDPLSVDAITDATGRLDLDAGELRLTVIDEHGAERAEFVMPLS